MKSIIRRWGLLGLLFAVLFGVAGQVGAQTGPQVIVSYPEVIEEASAVSLEVYFTLADSAGQVITEAEIESGSIALGDGSSYAATISRPGESAYVVLVLDASGSMAGAMTQLKQAAVQAVEGAPDGTYFAVVKFDHNISLLQDFTQDRNRLTEQINTLYPGGGTCLYDAAYRGVEILSAAPRGRRAVLLFTDGVDMTGAGTPCSQHTVQEVIDFASTPSQRVPIHVIGLSSGAPDAINEEELRHIASSTGGLGEIGQANSLSLLFQRIINNIIYQWVARADIYPKAGENSAQVTIRLADGTDLKSNSIPFTITKDYIAPPSAMVNSVRYTNTGNVILDLTLTGADRIAAFDIQIIDVRNNIPSPAFSLPASAALEIPGTNFTSGNEYQVTLIGLDSGSQKLFETPYTFRYDPTAARGEIRIISVQPDYELPGFVLELQPVNLEGLTQYEIWLNDKATNTLVPDSRQVITPGTQIQYPLEGIGNGTYHIVVTAVSSDGEVLAQSTYEDAVYKVGLVRRLGRIATSPFVIGGLVLIVLAGAGFMVKVFVLDPRKEKPSQVLLENTMVRRGSSSGGGRDAWDEDALRENRRRLREAGSRQRERQTPSVNVPAAPAPAPRPAPTPTPAPAPAPAPVAPSVSQSAPRASLTVTKSADDPSFEGQEYRVSSMPFTVGREGNQLNLNLPGISRKHATISFAGGQFFIRDEGSTNGTHVDGETIPAHEDIPLAPGAEIRLGKRLRVRFDVQ